MPTTTETETVLLIEQIATLNEALGPSRVKTKEFEADAHSPLVLQKLLERSRTKAVTLAQFPGSYVTPLGGACIKDA